LSTYYKNNAGRNNTGKVTILSKGTKSRSNYIFVDRLRVWSAGLCYIASLLTLKKKLLALIKYINGSYSYTPLAYGSHVGQVMSTTNLPRRFWHNFKPGNVVLLKFLKKYSLFFNYNNYGKILYARASGTFCQIVETLIDTNVSKILLPSGAIKKVPAYSYVTVGRCSNVFNSSVVYGKAGYLKFKGKKPKNRGVARNPVDHPHGGRTKTNSPEVSPWGWVAKRNK